MSLGWGHCSEAQLIEHRADSDDDAILALEPGEVGVVADLAAIYGSPADMALLGERMTDRWSNPRVTRVTAVARSARSPLRTRPAPRSTPDVRRAHDLLRRSATNASGRPVLSTWPHPQKGLVMTSTSSGIRIAEPGEVWVLTHRYREQGDLVDHVGVFRDPRRAILDLAGRIRPYWDAERARAAAATNRPPLPASPPEDGFAAVALFFADPGHDETRDGFHTFNLALHTIDADTLPTSAPVSEHALVLPFEEYVCVCGNTPDLSGFQPCDPAGNVLPDGPGPGWEGNVLCAGCRRIIATPTGLVTGRLSQPVPPPDDTRVDLDALAVALRERGHDAMVEQTGGNVATLYAGPQALDRRGEARWAAAAGPGWFEGPAQEAFADTTELYVGPDGNDTWEVAVPAHASTGQIVTLLVAVIDDVQAQRGRFSQACEAAREAMWTAFAAHYPDLTAGDVPPAADHAFVAESGKLLAGWLEDNQTGSRSAPVHIVAAARGTQTSADHRAT
jgi:hypothetical protein